MEPSIYASFHDLAAARSAMSALINAGQRADTIHLACKAIAEAKRARASVEGAEEVEQRQDFGALGSVFPDIRGSTLDTDQSTASFTGRYSGIAAEAGASAHPAQMNDVLWDALPDEIADRYRKLYEDGQALLVVHAPIDKAESIIREHGGAEINRQGYLA